VGLGTDSLVSVPDLDLHAEARAAGLRDDDALRALTLEGARALGLAGQVGSLEVGKAADLAVFTAPPAGPALLTLVAGRVVHAA
jgi:5-methylthioadenosine/S-adenosylhomocysteine deaminase